MPNYRFFFSYASEAYNASKWTHEGHTGNRIDEFYDALCGAVAIDTGELVDKVGYRDQRHLSMSSFWGDELIDALQQSKVIVSIINPHYLGSSPCGREIEFFRRRFDLLPKVAGVSEPHRIIPVFWSDKGTCDACMTPSVAQLFHELQLRDPGMPASYPHTGVHTFYNVGTQEERNRIVLAIARAIRQLSSKTGLPALPGAAKFDDLPSFFDTGSPAAVSPIAIGPKGTNVVYAVATQAEAAAHSVGDLVRRGSERALWRPFADAPGANIEMATQEGLNGAGQEVTGYRNLGMPADLVAKMRQARNANSPVLIVVDRPSLRVPAIADPLAEYDDRDFPHVGLVTAGGQASDEALVDQVMPTKHQQNRANHLWPVPLDRAQFVQGIVEVIGGLRRCLQQTGATAISLPPGQVPGL